MTATGTAAMVTAATATVTDSLARQISNACLLVDARVSNSSAASALVARYVRSA